MLTAPRITIEELKDEDEKTRRDFTPDHLRTWPRWLKLEAGEPGTMSAVKVTIAELDYDTPDSLGLCLYIDKGAGFKNQVFLEGLVSVEQLDAAIEALTLARDAAICEGMIAPVA